MSRDGHNLYATVLGVGARKESKALSTGYLAGLALLDQGAILWRTGVYPERRRLPVCSFPSRVTT